MLNHTYNEAQIEFKNLPKDQIVSEEDMDPDTMTVKIMKNVLKRASIPFKSNERRNELLLKVKSIKTDWFKDLLFFFGSH